MSLQIASRHRSEIERYRNTSEYGVNGMTMEKLKKIPKRLYRYRDLSNRTLDMIVSDHLYYADPRTFNDPLDSRPSVKIDLDEAKLEKVLRDFVERRTSAEMTAAAKTIRYRGPRTIDHIKLQSRRQADRIIEEIEYHATDPEHGSENRQRSLLGQYIEAELLQQYDKGIVSLAERATCPLMWSHYGDQHRGVCIGYSVPVNAVDNLHKVKYGGSRLVEISKVAAMLSVDNVARGQVDEAVLLQKAASWRYEREWRLIGPRGLQNSPLELEVIIFGIRCEASAKYALMKALENRDRSIKFYEMHEVPGTFMLQKSALNYEDQMFGHFPRRSLTMSEAFEAVTLAESSTRVD